MSGYGIIDVAKDFVTGQLEIADHQAISTRRQLCNSCEARNATLDVCTACGCFLPAKIKLVKSSCPMELW